MADTNETTRFTAEQQQLQTKLLAAHSRDDLPVLASLYQQAAEYSEQKGVISEARFFYTHALVYALDAGLDKAEAIRQRLELISTG